MKLFYDKYIFFKILEKKYKNLLSKIKLNSVKKIYEKRIKELSIKKIRINAIGFFNRSNDITIEFLFCRKIRYQIKKKNNAHLFTYYSLKKRKKICKIQYLH